MTSHIALLGDSILDNAAYTSGAPDVVSHLRDVLPPPWRATLCAIDGSTADELSGQLRSVPADADHLIVSTGGNDVLMNLDLLALPVASTTEALVIFNDRVTRFEASYRAAIDAALKLNRRTTTCTIYNGRLEPSVAESARVALMMFNVIIRCAIERRLTMIDLRLVCSEAADYANPIEPSGSGGRKIAAAIARSVLAEGSPTRVFAG